MSILNINTKPVDLNKVWDKTPTPLKYLFFGAVMMVSSYLLLIRKNDTIQLKELEKIEQSVETAFQFIDKFEDFQNLQLQYNEENNKNIENLHTLVLELNENVNTKFNYILISKGKYDQNLIDKMNLLDESFDKLSKIYEPTDNKNNQK